MNRRRVISSDRWEVVNLHRPRVVSLHRRGVVNLTVPSTLEKEFADIPLYKELLRPKATEACEDIVKLRHEIFGDEEYVGKIMWVRDGRGGFVRGDTDQRDMRESISEELDTYEKLLRLIFDIPSASVEEHPSLPAPPKRSSKRRRYSSSVTAEQWNQIRRIPLSPDEDDEQTIFDSKYQERFGEILANAFESGVAIREPLKLSSDVRNLIIVMGWLTYQNHVSGWNVAVDELKLFTAPLCRNTHLGAGTIKSTKAKLKTALGGKDLQDFWPRKPKQVAGEDFRKATNERVLLELTIQHLDYQLHQIFEPHT